MTTVRKTRIHTNDWLVEQADGSYLYLDSCGGRAYIPDLESLWSWAAEEGIEIDEHLERWLNGEE